MLMNFLAVGCFLIVGGVMVAMWRFDARNSNGDSKNTIDRAKEEKGRKTR